MSLCERGKEIRENERENENKFCIKDNEFNILIKIRTQKCILLWQKCDQRVGKVFAEWMGMMRGGRGMVTNLCNKGGGKEGGKVLSATYFAHFSHQLLYAAPAIKILLHGLVVAKKKCATPAMSFYAFRIALAAIQGEGRGRK